VIAYAWWVRTAGFHATCALGAAAIALASLGVPAVSAGARPIATSGAAAISPAPAAIPPELGALEQQMAQLHFNSERFRIAVETSINAGAFDGMLGTSVPEVAPSGAGLSAPVAVTSSIPALPEGVRIAFSGGGEGVASISPPAGEFTIKEGKTLTASRLIGNTLYQYEPSALIVDRHRPWVSHREASSYQLLGGSSPLAEGALPGSQGSFAGLIALLAKAQRIEATGPNTLASGQRVSGFTAIISPADVIVGPNGRKELQALTKYGIDSVVLEAFITPSGLPARIRVTLVSKLVSVAFGVEVLALEVPVAVKPPPARQTITAARLRRLESRSACLRVPVSKHKTRRVCLKPGPVEEHQSLFGLGG
jgi:hypothetical protein